MAAASRKLVREVTGRDFPSDPLEQLDLAVKAVFASWYGKRAHDYREYNKIPHDLGTAVSVVTMVFGNMGDDSGTGVAFTRDPNTGEKVLFGEYLTNAQGEDVVAGIRTPRKISQMREQMPEVYRQFEAIAERLERHYRDAQDLEFTIERGHLYMLQTRSAKRTAAAAVKIAADLVREGIIDRKEALARIEPAYVDQLLRDQFDPIAKARATRLATGLNASPGAAVGLAVFDADRAFERAGAGDKVILVRVETSPDDFHGMAASQGVLTARGGATSHAAVVARQIGKPCVAGCSALVVDYETRTASADGVTFKEGDAISLDGSTGEVFLGALPTVEVRFEDQTGLQEILGWADDVRRLQVWTNADKPEEAALARRYGAQGIGLCRTEHMFREGERLEIVRDAILVAFQATRAKDKAAAGQPLSAEEQAVVARFDAAMGKLEALQEGDFRGIFEAMSGLPVVIRLIDPPLHEFLPNHSELLVEVTQFRDRGTAEDDPAFVKARTMLAAVEALREQNPMLGLRGCRLGLMIPDFVKIQTRAILNAAISERKAGRDPHAEIMIPLVGHVNELVETKRLLEAEAKAVVGQGRRVGRLQVRHDDRGAARRPDRRRDRPARRVLQLRHQRPDADDVRLLARRRRGRLPARLRRAQDPALRTRSSRWTRSASGSSCASRSRRAAACDRASRSASAASTAATRPRSPSATRSAWTTSPARRSASRSPASPPPRPPSPPANGTSRALLRACPDPGEPRCPGPATRPRPGARASAQCCSPQYARLRAPPAGLPRAPHVCRALSAPSAFARALPGRAAM